MYKRILAFVFVALFVVLSVPISAFAEETPEWVWKDLDKTTVKEDLSEVVLLKYVKNASIINPCIVSLAEQGFSENQNYDECALYVYIYNPTGNAIKTSGLNKIQMKQGDVNNKYALKHINTTGVVSKFRINLPKSFFEQLDTNKRMYEIVSVELQYTGESEIHDYKIGGTYTFTGKGKDARLEKVETFEVVSLDINYTTFRNTSSLGLDYKNQLTSVYFSIPNYLLKQYNNKLYGIDCVYEKYYTKPVIITNNQEVYNALDEYKFISLDVCYGEKVPYYFYSPKVPITLWSGKEGVSTTQNSFSTLTHTFDWSFNVNFAKYEEEFFYSANGYRVKGSVSDKHFMSSYLPIYIYQAGVFDKNFWVSQEVVRSKFEDFYLTTDFDISPYEDSAIGDYYNGLIFENYILNNDGSKNIYRVNDHLVNSAIVRREITVTDGYLNMDAYDLASNRWSAVKDAGFKMLFASLENDFDVSVKPLEVIKSKDYKALTDELFSTTYAVNKNEISDLKSAVVEAEAKNETMYIFRLDVSPYYAVPVYTDISGKGYTQHDNSFDVFMMQEPVYMGFDVLDLLFKNENGEIVRVSVSSDPDNLIGGGDPPNEDIVDNSKPLADKWAEIKALIEKYLKIFALVLGALLVITFIPYLVKFVQALIDSMASILQGATNKSSYKSQRRRRKRK